MSRAKNGHPRTWRGRTLLAGFVAVFADRIGIQGCKQGERMNAKALALALGIGCLSVSAPITTQPVPTGPVITDPVYTKADQLVDVGGGRCRNLHCRGTGSPAAMSTHGVNEFVPRKGHLIN